MLKESIQQALNDQLNAELYSSYLYLSMAAYLQANDLSGMAHWMKVQAQEELLHVGKYYDYIHDRAGRVLLTTVEAPPTEWSSPLDAFQKALEHEQLVTGKINTLVDLANTDRDHGTANFLQWFVAEQVEEEASVSEIVGQLKIISDNAGALYMLDRELAKRMGIVPPPVG